MPCYDDRHGNTTRLYVGHLSSRTRSRDLEHIFSRYGRVRDVDMKQEFAFVDFSDPRDADDAIYSLNGRQVDGRRIIVELAKGVPRGPGGAREYIGRGPPPGSGRCFNCGLDGHWARDCKAGDWKNKCYRCGERGHVERNCKNSPKKLRHGPSYSRSPVRSHSPRRGRGRSPSYSRSRSYSRSPSPPARERFVDRDDWRSRSPYGGSPPPRNDAAPSRSRKRSATPDEGNTRGSESPLPLPKKVRLTEEYDEDIQSPVRRSRSPVSYEREGDAGRRYDDCPFEANGVNGSPGAGEDRSPVDDAEEERSPRGSESP